MVAGERSLMVCDDRCWIDSEKRLLIHRIYGFDDAVVASTVGILIFLFD